MAQENILNQFYTCLNLPLQEKVVQLSRIIEEAPNKDLQTIFPHLVSNIFATFNSGWGLRVISFDSNRYDFEALIHFLEPQGPMFRLCYKLLSDPVLKYNLPLSDLPLELQITLERGRCAQFYADLINVDSHTMNIMALALNPFDYYIMNFALHLVSNNQSKCSWENWNSAYFALACDYLIHFLPTEPSMVVLPHLPHFTGKGHMAAPLQTANRPYSPSLLLLPDLSPGMNSQHSSTQNQSRNEVWRSETVLQIFIDIWMSIEYCNAVNFDMFQRNNPGVSSSPERVRIVRVLVKHIHSYSAKHLLDLATRSSALRKYAQQLMCNKGYHYIKHLVTTWPLDASFRLVLELWLSLIQPWRYMDKNITHDRYPHLQNHHQYAQNVLNSIDASYMQFLSENFPCYTYIFQLVLTRFMRLDLASYKNAVMLFRLGKAFSQPHLVQILWCLENGIVNGSGSPRSPHTSYNNSFSIDHSNNYNGIPIHKWVAVAKQAISEINIAANFEYEPIWGETGKHFANEFVKKIRAAQILSDKNVQDILNRINNQNQGLWPSIKNWLMIGDRTEDELLLEESKKVPTYLNSGLNFFTSIFGLNDDGIPASPSSDEDTHTENSTFVNSANFAESITSKLRHKPTDIHYMGDPDLMPIMSHESTILVRMLYQIATKLNEMYGEQFLNLWHRNDLSGFAAREVLQAPITTHTFVKDVACQRMVSQDLPPRLSLRKLGSHAFVIWNCIGYVIFRMFSYSGYIYIFFITTIWMFFILTKASLKLLRVLSN